MKTNPQDPHLGVRQHIGGGTEQAKAQAAWTAQQSDKLIKAAILRLKGAKDEASVRELESYNKKLQEGLDAAAKALGKGLEAKSLDKKVMPKLGAGCGSILAVKLATQKEAGEQLAGAGAPRKSVGNIAGPFTAVPSPLAAKASKSGSDGPVPCSELMAKTGLSAYEFRAPDMEL